jgi:hypothetical protein
MPNQKTITEASNPVDSVAQDVMSAHPTRLDWTAAYAYSWAAAQGFVPEDLLHDKRETERA